MDAATRYRRPQSAPPTRGELGTSTQASPRSTSDFHPELPRISTQTSADLASVVRLLDHAAATQLILDGHALCCLSLMHWTVAPGKMLPCLSLNNIEVEHAHRRQGHARRCLRALSLAAGDNRLAFVVYNVVSAHMHTLLRQLGSRCLPSTMSRGLDGCSYWVPPSPPSAHPLHLVDVPRFAPMGLPPFRLGLEVRPFQLCLCGCAGCVKGTCGCGSAS